jgi:hypothetical protein
VSWLHDLHDSRAGQLACETHKPPAVKQIINH